MKVIPLLLALLASSLLSAEERVILHLLDQESEPKEESRFWIDWSDKWMAVTETKEMQGEAAGRIISLLGAMLSPHEATHFCGHHPVYGIEAFRADGMKLKTSLCFDCLTWVKPGKRLSISGARGTENKLCVELQKHLELPKEGASKTPLLGSLREVIESNKKTGLKTIVFYAPDFPKDQFEDLIHRLVHNDKTRKLIAGKATIAAITKRDRKIEDRASWAIQDSKVNTLLYTDLFEHTAYNFDQRMETAFFQTQILPKLIEYKR